MCYVCLFVTLKIPDNIALTALHTLRERMEIKSLQTLKRSEFWEIGFSGLSSQQVEQIVEQWARKTALFANPNKHRYTIQVMEKGLDETPSPDYDLQMDSAVLVCDKIDGKAESTLEALNTLADETGKPTSLRRGIWWDLDFQGLSHEEIQQTTENIAVTKYRMEGLLANPHYQSYHTFYSRKS